MARSAGGMINVFVWLSVSQYVVLIATAALGLLKPGGNPNRHVALAVFSLLLCCLIQVVVFTYFTITGKMIVQAVHLAGFGIDAIDKAKRFKRRVTRFLGVILACVVFVTATGARRWAGDGTHIHLLAASVFLIAQLAIPIGQLSLIQANAALVADTLEAYRRKKCGGDRSVSRGTDNDNGIT